MEQSKKNLRVSSIVVLVFAGLTLLQIVSELLLGELNEATIPEGAPDNILLITKIILLAVTVALLLPQIYIGCKGLRVAKNPDSSKAHIVWAVILLVFSVLGLISPVVNMIEQGGIYENTATLLSVLLEVVIYFEYIKYAKEVSKLS